MSAAQIIRYQGEQDIGGGEVLIRQPSSSHKALTSDCDNHLQQTAYTRGIVLVHNDGRFLLAINLLTSPSHISRRIGAAEIGNR
jgi:hypothetical protein